MARVEKSYVFDGPDGEVSLLELFEGRAQLLLYHFMFAPGVDGWASAGCPGCSMFTDNIGQFAPAHLNARGVSLALVSRAPLANIEAYRQRMSWPHRWVSSANNTFNVDFGMTTQDGEQFKARNPSFYEFYNGEHAADFKGFSDLMTKIDPVNSARYEQAAALIAVWDQKIYDPKKHLFFIGTTELTYLA